MVQFYVNARRSNSRDWNAASPSTWFNDIAAALVAKGISLNLGNGVTIATVADATNLGSQLQLGPAALATKLGVDPTLLASYLGKVFQVADNLTSSVATTATGDVVDVSPGSELATDLDLVSNAPYATTGKVVTSPTDTFTVGNVKVSVDPLNGKNYFDRQTFAGTTWSFGRDSTEIEVNRRLGGISGPDLNKALQQTDSKGRTLFQVIRKGDDLAAYTVGYDGLSLDEIPWDEDSHEARMKSPYVNLTVEDGRFDRAPLDPAKPTVLGPREISLGTDDFFDDYLETADNRLERDHLEYRLRDRRDTPSNTTGRRLLVQMKDGTVMDKGLGVKEDHKVDNRSDGATPDQVQNLLATAENGYADWNFGPLDGAHAIFDHLDQAHLLQKVGPHDDVVQLQNQLYMDSLRSRVHLNETPASALRTFMINTTAKLASVVSLATAAQATAKGADLTRVNAVLKAAAALQDGSAITALALPDLKKLAPQTAWTPDLVKPLMQDPTQPTAKTWDLPTLAQRKVVADATAKAYADFAKLVKSSGSALTGASEDPVGYADLFKAYEQQADPTTYDSITTFDPFLAKYQAIEADTPANQATALADFNTWLGTQKDAKGNAIPALDAAGFTALGKQLQNKAVTIWSRQLAEGGSAADGLYFDEARLAFANAWRSGGNFIINTFDWTNYVTPEAWDSIPDAIRNDPSKALPLDKVFDSTLINESQIELGNEAPYTTAIAGYQAQIAQDRAGMVMRYLDTLAPAGAPPADPSTYLPQLKTALKTAASAKTFVDGFNAFLKAQGSGLAAVKSTDLKALPDTVFTAAAKAAPVRTDDSVEQKLAGTQWVFKQILGVQDQIVDDRFGRVKKGFDKAGLDTKKLTWNQPEGSKLQIGLKDGRADGVVPAVAPLQKN